MLFYRDKAGVPEKHFLDMEMVTYKEEYIRAMMAHKAELWTGVIRHLEMCVEDYFVQDERCQADCQGKTRMRGTEFSTGIADLIIDILTCRLNCEEQLSAVYSEPIDFFLQDIFHYLNFAYYKVGDYEKSAEAIASCLQLNGSHQVMKDNKEVLKKKIDYADEDFVARESVVEYAAQKREMQDLMDFINKNYKWPDINENVEDEEEDEDILQQDNVESDDWMTRYEKLGMHIIAKAEDLSRAQRFVTDGLLKPEQCEELLMLVEGIPVKASGALTFTLKLAQERLERSPDEEYEASLRLFIRAAEAIRHYTQRYTEAPDAYYLKHTSVVCWSQPSELKEKLDCYRQEHGSCVRFDDMSDELYVDAFTTVTYLNTADEDGDFVFLGENRGVDNSFGVKCGRTVGFNSGDRHTLKIPKGNSQRCAMVIDYTIYRSDDEKEYQDTLSLLHRVDELRLASAQKSSEVVMKAFDDKGVKIVKKSDDLQGKERFVADGLATDAQCNTLRNMVLEMGKAGDGYEGQKSPHTINEMFAGLSLVQVAQSGALVGDGYDHLKSKTFFVSPHTEHELYQGITIYRASKLMHMGMISTFGLRAFLELSEDARLLVEKYFNLTKPLYFDYTHLVCRTAIDDSKSQRQDLSHPVHADNCLLQPDGSCTKDYPAFTQRDYSAILYLNADFEGGEFFFAHSNKSEQVSLRPKCGRLVGFNAGEFHGVRAVKSGQRCALALWFTHNPNFKELAHIQARKTLKQVEKDQQSEEKIVHEDL
ncbi:prolyl 3-hydroxylase 1 [Aplysia californica]|uniref:procollagen-proline 3-dioxygenase n=1 Tax=Aplysia californica TaxID=6500 RepID=A0ABM1A0K2_APLCA|nr:prolyl 3-hydroxylase 1 [Aplysia californica]